MHQIFNEAHIMWVIDRFSFSSQHSSLLIEELDYTNIDSSLICIVLYLHKNVHCTTFIQQIYQDLEEWFFLLR